MASYIPLLVMIVLAGVFAAGSFAASALLGPRRPTAAKEAPYESGIVPTRGPAQRFPVRFYVVAMIFVILDIEIVFTYPWAVIYSHDLGRYGLVEMIVFTASVLISFLYLVSNGALDWGPVKRSARSADSVESERTSSSSVRRAPAGAAREPAVREPATVGAGPDGSVSAAGGDGGAG
jgi:NADH-quinone oxidoreductase subunit A